MLPVRMLLHSTAQPFKMAFPCCPQSYRLEGRGHVSQVDDASPGILDLGPVNG